MAGWKVLKTAYVAENVESGVHSSNSGGSENLYNHFKIQYGRFSVNWELIYLKT